MNRPPRLVGQQQAYKHTHNESFRRGRAKEIKRIKNI